MRIGKSLVLAGLLLRFFLRRVLRAGALRHATVRIGALLLVGLLLVACAASAYFFLRPIGDDERVWTLLFQLSTISMLLWVQVAFLFVKVLFLNAEGMLELSHQLPVTNRERALAFLIYEATMVGLVSGAGALGLTAAAVIVLGWGAAEPMITSLILPGLLAYLLLACFYQGCQRFLAIVGLARMRGPVSVLVLFCLILAYFTQIGPLTSEAADGYLAADTTYVWVSAIDATAARFGFWPMLGGAVAMAAAGAALLVLLTPNQYVRTSRYLLVPVPHWIARRLSAYDWALLRGAQTGLAASVAVVLFASLCLRHGTNPLWAWSLLSMGGLYHYAATTPLRLIQSGPIHAWRIYGRLLRAQTILVAMFLVPSLAIVGLIDWHHLISAWQPVTGVLIGTLLALCIGTVFPAENDNPFSVFIGLSLAVALFGLVGLALGALSLPGPAVGAVMVGVMATLVWYAAEAIRTTESRRRNEEGHPGREQRRRLGSHHAAGRGGSLARADVLD